MTLKVSIWLAVSGGSSLKMSNLNHFEKYFLLEPSVKLRKKRKWVKQCLEKGALRVAEFFPYDGTMVKISILIMRSTETSAATHSGFEVKRHCPGCQSVWSAEMYHVSRPHLRGVGVEQSDYVEEEDEVQHHDDYVF